MIVKYKVTQIRWDTDGEKVKLPKQLTVTINVDNPSDSWEVDETISDALSNKYGWCVAGYNYEPIKNDKFKNSQYLDAVDIVCMGCAYGEDDCDNCPVYLTVRGQYEVEELR